MMTIPRAWFALPLWKRVLGALALGLVFALALPEGAPAAAFIGDLFVHAIRMLVALIMLVTIAAGITSLADPKRPGGFVPTSLLRLVAKLPILPFVRAAPAIDAEPMART